MFSNENLSSLIRNRWFLIGIGALILFYLILQAFKGGDFKIYLGAAELLREGKSCYNVWIHLGGDNYCGYSYGSFFAILLIPFTYLPNPVPALIWLIANIFFLFRIGKILSLYLNFKAFTPRQIALFGILSFILTSRFLMANFEMVQMTIFLVFICLEVVYRTQNKKPIGAGILLGLGIVIKVIPIILIPYLLYRKAWKPVGIAILTFTACILLPALFFGWSFNLQLLTDWVNVINPANSEFVTNQNEYGEGVNSLSGFVSGYFTDFPSTVDAPFDRNIANLNERQIFNLLNVLRLLFVMSTLYFLRSRPWFKFKSNQHTFWELSYIMGVVPLIFPHQQKYAFFFLAPATFYLIHFLMSSYIEQNKGLKFKLVTFGLVLFLLTSILTTSGIIGVYLSNIASYYKLITFGAIFLLICLAISTPTIQNEKDIQSY